MDISELEQEEVGRRLLQALLDGDPGPALELLEELWSASETKEDRIRYGLAQVRLLISLGRLEEARSRLEQVEAEVEAREQPEWAAQVALERVVLASRAGDHVEARNALAQLPEDLDRVPDEPLTRAIQEMAGLAALRGAPVPREARRVLDAVHPVNRVAVEANLLLAEGRTRDAQDLLARQLKRLGREMNLQTRTGLLLQLAAVLLLSGRYKQAIARLKEARACAVDASDVYQYLAAAALLVICHASLQDHVNAYAVCVRAMVSLEDLLGKGAGRMFEEFLAAFRQAWGEAHYREVALQYISLRKSGAIQ